MMTDTQLLTLGAAQRLSGQAPQASICSSVMCSRETISVSCLTQKLSCGGVMRSGINSP